MREDRLRAVVENYRHVPFTWTVHDCVLFAARCVDAQIGTRLEHCIRRDYTYTNAITALRVVIEAGGWEKIIGRYLGPGVEPERIEFGDVVLGHSMVPFERTTLLGICDEEKFMVPDTNGLYWLPMSHALKGWKLDDIAAYQRQIRDG